VVHTVDVTNSGNVALRSLTFTADGSPLNSTCSTPPEPGTLAVGSTVSCHVVYGVDQDAVELGTIIHGAAVTALPSAGSSANFSEAFQLAGVTAASAPSLSITINTATCSVPNYAGG
jgi:hypothetical protein